jgi:ABC-2 type transport system ATP-binding protein
MSGETLVRAAGLHMSYGSVRAVQDLNLAVARGEILGLLGPNGAGKSSTMRMICGVLRPDRGSVEICGVRLDRDPIAAKRRLGYLPERPPLYRTSSVDEFLTFCARLRRTPSSAIGKRLALAKEQSGLQELGARLIRNLSKGMQQRVGIAQAIIHDPDVVVLDEPTAGLDPNQVREVRALIRRLRARHAVIVSTHILPEVTQSCDRVVILREGRVVHDAPLSLGADHACVVSLQAAPAAAELLGLPGVTAAEAIEPHRYRVTLARGLDGRAALAAAIVQRRWGLLGLTSAAPDLERLFIELTCSDPQAQA